ncbi:divergent polysaccharide deacetylase family protein [Chromatiaceae bacterium AAb-1]|nr:divergent polysaccharide deacetylase family protein [Chromatiaceae bacterium AAb-1]
MRFLQILLSCFALLNLQLAAETEETTAHEIAETQPAAGRIVIIIDDIGYHKSDARLVELPYPLTFAVLPHTPYGQRYAKLAYQQQKDVMLHMPMESSNGKALGPGGLTQEMSREQVHATLEAALADIPYAIGVNNHMGSLYTELEQPMSWTMEYLQQRRMFFVDSVTTPRSKAREQAARHQVVTLSRQVFLDNELDNDAIQKQFDQLLRIARKYKTAIGIAHPHQETYQFLKEVLPQLADQHIELVGISALLPDNHHTVSAGFTAPAQINAEDK